MRIAPHLRVSVLTLFICALLSGNPAAIVDPLALAFVVLVAWVAHKSRGCRQGIESSCLLGLPICCLLGAASSSSIQEVGRYLAFGLCVSLYGLTWFGLDSGTPDPAWRRWTTAVPVLTLLGPSFPVLGSGLGGSWAIYALSATAVVVFVAIWRRDTNPTALWSFAAAVTLSLGVRAFQASGQPSVLDAGLVFLPYAAGLFATLAGRTVRLLHHTADTQPIGEQLRPLR